MEQMRYDVFNLIHKGLRLMLYQTGTLIQQTDFSNVEKATPVIKQLEKVLYYFDSHADHENAFILPSISNVDPRLVVELESDHEEDHELSKEISDLIYKWKISTDFSAMEKIGRQIHYTFSEFTAFNLYHMNKEEKAFNAALWKSYSDMEILGMEQNIVNSIPPDELIEESRWIMRAIKDTEIINWIRGLKQGAPEEVFNVFLNMAKEELPEERWIKVKAGVEEERERKSV